MRKFATAASVEDLIAKTEQRTHVVDPYTGHLHQRWHDGERNATQLFREIQQLGYPVGELAVQRYLRQFRHGLTLPHRSGPAEGNINRIKMLKRQTFGRASLDLLRKRELLAH